MPNVMGREFPYTPEGMAAAQQYAAAVGMRGGGMMGFRPLGMDDGGDVEAKAIVRGLYDIMRGGTTEAVRAYIEANRADLEMIAKENPDPMFNMLRSVLPEFPPADITPTLPGGEAFPDPLTQPGVEALQPTIESVLDDEGKTAFGLNIEGFVPPGLPEAQGDLPDSPDSPMILEGLRRYYRDQPNSYFDPNEIVLADGGYIGRGTMAGELSPRGSMSVREEGETMREMAKRMGKRNGGIMSLRRY